MFFNVCYVLKKKVVGGKVIDALRDADMRYQHEEDVIMFSEPEEQSM